MVRERLDVWASRLARVPAPISQDRPTPFVFAANGGAGHVDAVADCRRRIEAGELYQANLCVRLEARYDGDPLDLFARALPRAQPRFGALVGGVVSLSPERFLRRSGRDVWTEPIKGTRPRTGFADEDSAAREELLASTKDAAEHVMIVDLMRNDIGRVCAYGSVRAQAPRIEGHAGVWHLVSTVSGRLRDGVRDGELLRATFPPGSVTGAPKVQAMKVIATLEATRREVYTGAIGIASPIAGLDTSVVIRTFETAGDAIWIGAGGAIVADSDPEQELSEALTKAAGPVAAIGGSLARPRERPAHPPELCVHPGRAVERALLYGRRPDHSAGVFDTMLVEDGRPVAPELHLQRLAASVSEVYGATLPRTLAAGVHATAAEAASADGRARLRIDVDARRCRRPRADHLVAGRAASARGGCARAVRPARRPRRPQVARSPSARCAHRAPPRHAAAARRHRRRGARGRLRERLDRRGDDLITPPADGRILPGTVRATLLASEPGAREEPIELERFASAESIFLTSSITVRRPARLRRQVLVPVPVAALL